MHPNTMNPTCIAGGAVFSYFTYLQFNDLEEYNTEFWQGWVVTYGLIALLSFITAVKPLPKAAYLGCMLFTLIGAAFRFAEIEWVGLVFFHPTNPAANETGGLIITFAWLYYLLKTSRTHT